MADGLGREYRHGEVVVQQGDVGSCMYVIQEGRVEVVRESHGSTWTLGELEAGEVFGEMAIFEQEVRSATVRAIGSARILTIDRRTFLARVHEDPTLAFNILREMSRRIRQLSTEVADLRQDAGLRVTRELKKVT